MKAIKFLLIEGYCQGFVPAWIVTRCFRLLPLGSA